MAILLQSVTRISPSAGPIEALSRKARLTPPTGQADVVQDHDQLRAGMVVADLVFRTWPKIFSVSSMPRAGRSAHMQSELSGIDGGKKSWPMNGSRSTPSHQQKEAAEHGSHRADDAAPSRAGRYSRRGMRSKRLNTVELSRRVVGLDMTFVGTAAVRT